MARDVFMPALGMAQETGVILAWLKRPGDAVRAGEPLFEVETDKAVMAVDADADGVLGDLRHDDGAEVPVGEIIARILPATAATAPASADAVLDGRDPAQAQAAATPPPAGPPRPGGVRRAATDRPPAPPSARTAPTGREVRVLASPKTRRLAAERGIDLRAILKAGAVEPLHAADLDRVAASLPAAAAAVNRIAARAQAGAFLAFRALLAEEGTAPPDAVLWAAFAAGSLRGALDGAAPAPLVVAVERPGEPAAVFADPDLGPLADVAGGAEGAPALTLRDLSGRRLTEVALARDLGPVVSIAGGTEGFALALAWPDGALAENQAIALVEALAARIEQPLRHLL